MVESKAHEPEAGAKSTRTRKEKIAKEVEKAGSAAKRNKGLIIGAVVGTVAIPIPGVGTVVGGALGSLWD